MLNDDTPDVTALSEAACLVLLRHVPAYAQRILAVGTACDAFVACLQRPGVDADRVAGRVGLELGKVGPDHAFVADLTALRATVTAEP